MGSWTSIIEAVIAESDYLEHCEELNDLIENSHEIEIDKVNKQVFLINGRASVSSVDDLAAYCSVNKLRFYADIEGYPEVEHYKIVVSEQTEFSVFDVSLSEIAVSRAMEELVKYIEDSNSLECGHITDHIKKKYHFYGDTFNFPNFDETN